MKVLNMGSMNYDFVYNVEHTVKTGETMSSYGLETFNGGKGLNQSIAISRAGIDVFHAGLIGEDGDDLLKTARENGVGTQYIRKVHGKSGHTIIQVDKNGDNCIILYGGSNQEFTKEYIDDVLSDFTAGDILLLQNEINLIDYVIDEAYKNGMKIILNPSPFDSKLSKCDITKISVFILNEIEGEQLSGCTDETAMADAILKKYPNSKVVLTLGSKGAEYLDRNMHIYQEAYKVNTIDTTAAGDTFIGYFIAGLVRNIPLKENMMMCAKASSIAVTRKGAVPSIPIREEVV